MRNDERIFKYIRKISHRQSLLSCIKNQLLLPTSMITKVTVVGTALDDAEAWPREVVGAKKCGMWQA